MSKRKKDKEKEVNDTSKNVNGSGAPNKHSNNNHTNSSKTVTEADLDRGKEDDVKNDQQVSKPTHNDPRDYGSPELVKSAASWSWANRLGDQLPSLLNNEAVTAIANYSTVTSIDDSTDHNNVPGIMRLNISPTPGVSNSGHSAINIAAYIQYGFLRSNISGQRPYSKSDMITEWFAVDSCYMMGMSMDRAIATTFKYSQQNKYLAKSLVEAMGFDYDDLLANGANYRNKFNLLKARVNSLKIPAVLPIVKRHSFMMSNVYKDDEIEKAQLYVYTLKGFYRYNPASSAFYGLDYVNWLDDGETKTFNQWMNALETNIENISADDKFAQISGDIEKAYGSSNCLALGLTSEFSMIDFVYDAEMLYQIHHIKFVNYSTTETASLNPHIRVNTVDPQTYIEFTPAVETSGAASTLVLTQNWVLDSASEYPDADEGMTDTRLTPTTRWDNNANALILDSCGSEIVHSAVLYYFNVSGDLTKLTINTNNLAATSYGFTTNLIYPMMLLATFKKAPIFYIHRQNNGQGALFMWRLPYCEMKTYTVITNSDLSRAHNTAIQSQFSIPEATSTKLG